MEKNNFHVMIFLLTILVCISRIAALAEGDELYVEVDVNQHESSEEALASGLLVEIIYNNDRSKVAVGKRILIYHTHTYEAYEQTMENPYREIEKWRTADDAHNVIAVGKVLAAQLTALGMQVTHDVSVFEPPTLDDAYTRSLTMLEKRKANGEQYDLYIDLHRDALASASTIKRTVQIAGEEVARLMVLVGKGTTGGYDEKPAFESNKAIAQRITDALNRQCEGLARDVKEKTGRFNQHVDDCCVLIECGTNWNTLEEVVAAMPYLAQAILEALNVSE